MTSWQSTPVSRRTVTRGIAWATPTVLVASTIPAFAASNPQLTVDRKVVAKGTTAKRTSIFSIVSAIVTDAGADADVSDLSVALFLPAKDLTWTTASQGWQYDPAGYDGPILIGRESFYYYPFKYSGTYSHRATATGGQWSPDTLLTATSSQYNAKSLSAQFYVGGGVRVDGQDVEA